MTRSDHDFGLDVLGHGHGGGHGGHHHGGGGHRGGRGPWGWWGGWGGGYDDYYPLLVSDNADDETPDEDEARAAYYARKAGLELVGYVAPERHWYNVLVTPGQMKAELDSIKREGDTLDKDIRSFSTDAPGYPAFLADWKTFWSEFNKYYDDTGWLSRAFAGTEDKIIAYGNQLNDRREKFTKFPGASATEAPVVPVKHREDDAAIPWKTVLIGGLVVAGVIGGGYALSKVSGVAALFKKARP